MIITAAWDIQKQGIEVQIKTHSCDPDKCNLKAPEACQGCKNKGG